jgi:hypothetical protein
MRRIERKFALALCCAVLAHQGFGQTGPAVVAAVPGFGISFGTRVAPGQVATLQVANLKTQFEVVRATTVPLPETLAGVSVRIRQLLPAGTVVEHPVPLLAVFGQSVTVQIPFELAFPGPKDGPIPTSIVVSDNGLDGAPTGSFWFPTAFTSSRHRRMAVLWPGVRRRGASLTPMARLFPQHRPPSRAKLW